MQIEKLVVRRFKQLIDFELDLPGTTVLIGANNSGKSSVLQALHFAVSIAQTAKLVGEGVNWSNDKFQLSFNPAQLIYSPISDVLALATGGVLLEQEDQQIEIEVFCSNQASCKVTVRRGRNRNMQVAIRGRQLGERLMDMESPFTIYAPGLAGVPREERYMSPGVVRRVVARGDANLALRNVLLMLSKAGDEENASRRKLMQEKKIAFFRQDNWLNAWETFLVDMQALFPGISIEIKFNDKRDEHIEVFYTRNGKGKLPLDAAGTSILQASQILAYIALFRPYVLILDEPDSHLHADNQRVLCNLVVDLSVARGFRALISTHSRHVLDAMRDRANVVWLNKGKKVEYDSLTTASMLLDLGALDSVDYFAKGNLRCLFATEDSSADSILALQTLLACNGFVSKDTEIRAYSGCSKIDSAKVLNAFLTEKAPHVRFVLHRDRDYMDQASAVKFDGEITKIGAHPFLTPLSDVEGLFLNADHLAALNAPLTAERAQELIDQATEETKDKSLEKLINFRVEAALRNRNGGPAPNTGQTAITAAKDYEASPVEWRRGKIVLGRLKQLIQVEVAKNPVVLAPSAFLNVPELAKIASAIWPPANPVAANPPNPADLPKPAAVANPGNP